MVDERKRGGEREGEERSQPVICWADTVPSARSQPVPPVHQSLIPCIDDCPVSGQVCGDRGLALSRGQSEALGSGAWDTAVAAGCVLPASAQMCTARRSSARSCCGTPLACG